MNSNKERKNDDYGFILTRHVNCEKTNEYWNTSVQCIRRLYPCRKILVIDDNSDSNYVKAWKTYENVEILQSEFPKRGELLPYYYFYKLKPFQNAIILHDSVFFHERIPFERFYKIDVLPLWHFSPDKENVINSCHLISHMKNAKTLHEKLTHISFQVLGENPEWVGCFGIQAYIQHDFLSKLVQKYDLFQLLHKVRCRADRCCLERIFGVLFSCETKNQHLHSLLGNIHCYQEFGYSYQQYKYDFHVRKRLPRKIVKVWTGR
jgi:hypothetical protein